MKTLDYIHLDAVAAGKVVEALQQSRWGQTLITGICCCR